MSRVATASPLAPAVLHYQQVHHPALAAEMYHCLLDQAQQRQEDQFRFVVAPAVRQQPHQAELLSIVVTARMVAVEVSVKSGGSGSDSSGNIDIASGAAHWMTLAQRSFALDLRAAASEVMRR